MSIKLELPELTDLKPRLVVIGVGGAGCNAVNNMIAAGLTGVEFVVANTDAQALAASSAEYRLQLGAELTEGLGAGSKPDIGRAAAEEAIEDIRAQISGAHMVFVAAGMGGGTGTGAAATIAKVAKDLGILTVGVVTKPFHFEGARRMRIAEAGISELKPHVDTLIVIPNQNLFRLANEKTTFSEAFILADQVLYSGVACIVDLIIKEGLINLDFADVRTVISGMGSAMMGTGEAEGERRAILAAEEAIANPLLDDVSLEGARGLLLSITGGSDLTLYEVDEAASRVREEVDPDANIIVGATFDETLGDRVRVSIVASGMQKPGEKSLEPPSSNWTTPTSPFDRQQPAASQTDAAPSAFSPSSTPTAIEQTSGNQSGAYHQQLSAALQGAIGQEESRVSGQHDLQEPHYVPAESPSSQTFDHHHGEPVQPEQPATWTDHVGVTIEDGLPPLPHAQAATAHHDGSYAEATPQHDMAQAFEPQPPEALPRSGRRMPRVEDFPQHAQAEYRQKVEQHGLSDAHFGEPGRDSGLPRKRSLLDRLRGRTRRQSDSAVENGVSDSAPQPTSGSQRIESQNAGFDAPHNDHRHDSGEPRQDADLPMFFGRIAK